jgi:FdhE protein
MTREFDQLQPDPSAIGEISAPPDFVLPDAARLFHLRAQRLRSGGDANTLSPYILFLTRLAEAQAACVAAFADAPAPEVASDFSTQGAPPLEAMRLAPSETFNAIAADFFARAADIAMPEASSAALARVRACEDLGPHFDALSAAVIPSAPPVADLIFVAAAQQTQLSLAAAQLAVADLSPQEPGVCPVCGARAASSMVVGWQGAHGARFCNCAMCGSAWHYVRIRCVACGGTKGISYREIDGFASAAKAECCTQCRSFVKIFYQTKSPDVEPVADDVLSLGLDLLVREEDWRRAGFNPFLIGY